MVVQTAIYGSETWILRKNHEPRIQTAEVKFLRGIPGYLRIDHQRSTEIRGGKRLKVFNLNIKIQN